jgi:hypothetical protein
MAATESRTESRVPMESASLRSNAYGSDVYSPEPVLKGDAPRVALLAGPETCGAEACGRWIGPIWESPSPPWPTDRFCSFLPVRTGRTDEHAITNVAHAPCGANMAFRRNVFDRLGGFDTARGRKGQVLAGGEDGERCSSVRSHEA